jgi:plastocyanin
MVRGNGSIADSESTSSPRRTGTSLIVPLVALVLAVALTACSSGATHGAASRSTGASGRSITIKNFVFSPRTLTVSPGASVTVTNDDSVTHTLTSTTGAFNVGDVAKDATAHFTAPMKPGTYTYRCNIHQFMTGTLVVS